MNLALNNSNDIYIVGSQFALISSNKEIAQNITTRLQMYLNESKFDTSKGVPWLSILGSKNNDKTLIDSIIKSEILNTIGVKSIDYYKSEILDGRRLLINFTVNGDIDGGVTI